MNGIAWAIVACEFAFWVVIGAGLAVRYGLRREKLGLLLLALTPLIDLLLLVLTGVDLYRGAVATAAHGIAAIYIAVSVVFGRDLIRWADDRFRYYVIRSGARPVKRFGREHARHELKGFLKHAGAFLLGSALLLGIVALIDDPDRTAALSAVLRTWGMVLGIDLLITASYWIWPRKPTKNQKTSDL